MAVFLISLSGFFLDGPLLLSPFPITFYVALTLQQRFYYLLSSILQCDQDLN
jgi:hypothetical protein